MSFTKQDKKIRCVDSSGEDHFFLKSELIFRPSVYGILIEEGKVLLSKQWDGYDFPGGGINIDETVGDALKREFWEETGLKVNVGDIVECKSSFFKSKDAEKPFHSILIYFLVRKVGGEISINNIDESEKSYIDIPEWIDIEKMSKIKFYNSIDSLAVIEKAQNLFKS